MNDNKRNVTVAVFFVCLLVVLLGYSSLSTKKKISKYSKSKTEKFVIGFENINVKSGSIAALKKPEISSNSSKISFSVQLKNKEDYYEFTVDTLNKTENDAMISDIYITDLPNEQSSVIDYLVTYADGTEIKENDLLSSNSKETYSVLVKYKKDADLSMLDEEFDNTLNLEFSLDYVDADDNAKEVTHKLLDVKVGDYVMMTPTANNFYVNTTKTGYTGSNQKNLNPSELNMWRVIKKNSDNSFDMISDKVSSEVIYFEGETGYLNYIGYLNDISKAYTNSTYVLKTRAFGYSSQTEYITDKSKLVYPSAWTSSTTNNDNETLGGGDVLYRSDFDLVNNLYGTLKATKKDESAARYWIASRYFYYRNSKNIYWNYRIIKDNGSEDFDNLYYASNKKFYSRSDSASIRPIVTIKSSLRGITGSGTLEKPYILE